MFPLRDSHHINKYPLITNFLIFFTTLVFFFELIAPDTDAFIEQYALIPKLVDFRNWVGIVPFITSQFLHAGFLHILSNMWFLHIFGDNVEEKFGSVFYLFVYLASGAVGGLIQYLFSPNSDIPMLGASGAVAGVLGVYLVFFPRHQIETLIPFGFYMSTVRISAGFMLFYWFITQLFSGVGSVVIAQVGGVAFWAHVGGFTTGYLIAKLFPISKRQAEEGEVLDI